MYSQESEMDKNLYHDTWTLLKKYRDVKWSLELSVRQVQTRFQLEYGTSIDSFLDSMYLAGADISESKLNSHVKCIEQSHKMLQLMESAVSLMRQRHKHGEPFYWILYFTFLSPQQLGGVEEIVENLQPYIPGLPIRTYYRRAKKQ